MSELIVKRIKVKRIVDRGKSKYKRYVYGFIEFRVPSDLIGKEVIVKVEVPKEEVSNPIG